MIFIKFFKIPWYFQVFQVHSHFSRFSRSSGNPVKEQIKRNSPIRVFHDNHRIYINVNVIVIFVISENHAGIMSSGSKIFMSGCADSQSGRANPLLAPTLDVMGSSKFCVPQISESCWRESVSWLTAILYSFISFYWLYLPELTSQHFFVWRGWKTCIWGILLWSVTDSFIRRWTASGTAPVWRRWPRRCPRRRPITDSCVRRRVVRAPGWRRRRRRHGATSSYYDIWCL